MLWSSRDINASKLGKNIRWTLDILSCFLSLCFRLTKAVKFAVFIQETTERYIRHFSHLFVLVSPDGSNRNPLWSAIPHYHHGEGSWPYRFPFTGNGIGPVTEPENDFEADISGCSLHAQWMQRYKQMLLCFLSKRAGIIALEAYLPTKFFHLALRPFEACRPE